MAVWYVRPDSSHSGTRNGTSYATAWGGWSAITWGAGGVTSGDTLYVCGAHAYSSAINVGAHGANSEVTRVTIRGDFVSDPGSITFSSTAYLGSLRAYTTIRNISITAASSNCLYATAAATNCNYLNNTFSGSGGTSIFSFDASNNQNHSDILIDGNTFRGSTSSGVIQWLVSSAGAVSTMTRLTITNNVFRGISCVNGVINLRSQNTTSESSIITDLIIDSNSFVSCNYIAVRVGTDYQTPTQLCKGLKVRNNYFQGISQAAIAPYSWGNTATSGFGSNEISGNTIINTVGPGGPIDLFYGTYVVTYNTIDGATTSTIDANGVLADLGCDNVQIYGNRIDNCDGKAGVSNSGYAIMVLEATNVTAHGNCGHGNRNGIHIGDAGAGQSCTIHNNTFTGLKEYGIYAHASADLTTSVVKNNIFGGDGYSVYDGTATNWTGEDYNCFLGFSSGTNGHTLGSNDRSDNPILDPRFKPTRPQFFNGGANLGGTDFYGNSFPSSPSIGAIQCVGVFPKAVYTDYSAVGAKESFIRGRRR